MNDPKRRPWLEGFLLLGWLIAIPARADPLAANPVSPVAPAPVETTAVSDTAATGIQAILKDGVHPRLHWSGFPEYRAALEDFYRGRGFQPLWVHNGQPIRQADEVLSALAEADARGLNPEDYDAALLREWLPKLGAANSAQETALFDVAVSVSAARYASHLFVGRINPRNVDYGLSIEPKKIELAVLLGRLADGDDPREAFAALEPKLRLYDNLKAALIQYRDLEKQGRDVELALPVKLSPGDHHADIPKLRSALATFGELTPEDAANTGEVYDPPLVEAVKRFQKSHGIAPDGVIGKSTQAHLRVPTALRVKQIQLGLERLRWLPEQLQGRYIMVNIPSFELFGFGDGFGSGKPDVLMNVIVGEAVDGRRTPVFHADMTYVVFRPHWNLPYKIAVKEMLPGAMRKSGYLARHNIEVVAGYGPNSAVYAPSAENLRRVSSGALKLRQKPGPKNALGLVKFAFPNDNAVYLHSTPNQGLFSRARRDFSHGCIRVSDPVGLAEWVLQREGEWTPDRIRQAMNGSKPRTVTLSQTIPVYIFYSTVLADDQGRIMFFEDIYGHDRILQSLLDKGFPYPA